ncbi:F0F1 ATP synthase subunit A [Mariniflexile sp.]|uniref:F0F1 ATP synthase subunit A n=2 Tax=Mariniflexile sp. TaxID=1979402 RepID=UPI0040487357
MQRKIQTRLLLLFFTATTFFGFAGELKKDSDQNNDTKTSRKQEVKEEVTHHLLDSHDFGIYSYTDDETGEVHHVGFPLPIILWDDGLKVFSSSRFHHGEKVAEVEGDYYKIDHGKIYRTDASGTIKYNEEGHATNEKPLDVSITKGVFMMLVTAVLMFFLFRGLAKSYAKTRGIARGVGRFFEPIVIYIRDDIAIANIGEKKYKKYMPFLLTIFFFIWFLNMFGLTPFGVNVTGNIAVTTALAAIVFFITTFTGTKDYWKHIFDPLGDGMPWIGKIIIYIVLVPIEILGLFIKPFALLIRLYANMTAGHVVLGSLLGLIYIFQNWIGGTLSFGLAFAISLIEFFVALLQAYIFTILAALYFGFASETHEHAQEHEGEAQHL